MRRMDCPKGGRHVVQIFGCTTCCSKCGKITAFTPPSASASRIQIKDPFLGKSADSASAPSLGSARTAEASSPLLFRSLVHSPRPSFDFAQFGTRLDFALPVPRTRSQIKQPCFVGSHSTQPGARKALRRECIACAFRWLDSHGKDECPKCLAKQPLREPKPDGMLEPRGGEASARQLGSSSCSSSSSSIATTTSTMRTTKPRAKVLHSNETAAELWQQFQLFMAGGLSTIDRERPPTPPLTPPSAPPSTPPSIQPTSPDSTDDAHVFSSGLGNRGSDPLSRCGSSRSIHGDQGCSGSRDQLSISSSRSNCSSRSLRSSLAPGSADAPSFSSNPAYGTQRPPLQLLPARSEPDTHTRTLPGLQPHGSPPPPPFCPPSDVPFEAFSL